MAHKRNYITGNGVCQLLDKSKFLDNDGYINNGNGTITTKAVPTRFMRIYEDFDNNETNLTPKELSIAYRTYGHKMLIIDLGNTSSGTSLSDSGGLIWEINSTRANAGDSCNGQGTIFTNNKLPLEDITRSYFYIVNPSGYTFTCAPQLFDLTEMYGAGKEPTTVEEFKTRFPNDLYLYNRLFSTCCKKMIKVANICQLMDKNKYPATRVVVGITFTNNGDGSFTMTGTKTGNAQLQICVADIKKGHKYLGTTGTDTFYM